jgi:aromatic-L-amino-acid/L-tryptophan decarboxylase
MSSAEGGGNSAMVSNPLQSTNAFPGLSPQEFRRLGYQAVDLAVQDLATLTDGPVYKPMKQEERDLIREQPLPEHGASADAIFTFFQRAILPHPMGNGHPRFFGWVNSPPAMMPIISELLAAMMNPSCAGGDHAAVYLERCAVRWIMELIGYPTSGSMGLLVSGGSMASLTGLAAARHWAAQRDGWNVRAEGLQRHRPPFVLYISEECHSCVRKAAELLGLGEESIRSIAVDGHYRIDVAALQTAIVRDRSAGLRPFCVVASAGTVSTGAIDPLDALANLCEAERLWLHVDGAYGAVGILDQGKCQNYKGLERAHSLALDPHKWLSVPVECGCVLVREGELLRDAFSLVPAYIRTEPGKGIGGLPWYSEYEFQQTRGFRALKLWTALMHAGRSGLQKHIAGCNLLASNFASRIEGAPDLQLCAPVTLSVVCFRYVPETGQWNEHQLGALNKQIMETVQSSGEAFITNAALGGRFVLRACILNYLTTESDLIALIETVRRIGSQISQTMNCKED